MSQPGIHRITTLVLYATFMLTGTAVASPGALLPQLLRQWHLSDASGGLLLFLLFVGASLGGLASRGPLRWTLTLGCCSVAIAASLLPIIPATFLLPLIALFGFGLGLCMTSISLQRSRRHPTHRAMEFNRLNLVWATGACLGPSISIGSNSRIGLAATLYSMGAVFASLSLCMLLLPVEPDKHVQQHQQKRVSTIKRPAILVMIMIPLMTGLESSSGGWLTAYASRTGQHRSGAVGLVTIFWAGLLLSRLTHSLEHVAKKIRVTLYLYPIIAVAGVAILSISHAITWQLLGAVMIGWGVGPLYPVALALLLDESEAGNLGFVFAGIGGATLPLMTGFVSDYVHSIRAGLASLLIPGCALIVLAFIRAAQYSSAPERLNENTFV